MHDPDRTKPFYGLRTAVVPVLLLGTAAGLVAWHVSDLVAQAHADRIADLYDLARAQSWQEASIQSAVRSGFKHDELVRWLGHPAGDVREASAWALGHVGTLDDCKALAAAMKRKDTRTADAAADAMWRLWLQSGAQEAQAGMNRARKLLDEGRVQDAQVVLNGVILRNPELAEPYNQRARLFMIQHDYDAAIADASRAVSLNPYHFDAMTRMGECYLRIGRVREAAASFRAAVDVNPNLPPVWRRLAQIRDYSTGAGAQTLSPT